MHSHNDWYGHVRLLARYAGQPTGRPPRIWGYLQHGWNVHNGFGARTPMAPGMPRLVWSDGPRRRGWDAGEYGYRVIGAPWAYLLRLEPRLGVVSERRRRGTIFYPFHGFEKQVVFGDHVRLAAEIRSHETPPITVCLYWLDFQVRQIREAYERAGYRVICHGYRGGRNRAGDRAFLTRQLVELRRHRRVASNRLSTAILYGASVGCAVGIYGDEMLIEDEHPIYGGNARIRRLWPQMHGVDVPVTVAAEFAATELGLAHVASPAELADICGWTAPEPATGRRSTG